MPTTTNTTTTIVTHVKGIKGLEAIGLAGVAVLSIVFMVAYSTLYFALNIIGTMDTVAIAEADPNGSETGTAIAMNVLGWLVFPLFSVAPIVMRKQQLQAGGGGGGGE